MNLGLTGKHALVTGASSGLGLAIATALMAEGTSVTISGRSAARLEAAIAQLPDALRPLCDYVEADFADPGVVDLLIEGARRRTGQVDILVNNTGGPPPGPASAVDPDVMAAHYGTMVDPVIRLTLKLLPQMRAAKWGRILTVASSGVVQPIPHLPVSNALRASVLAFMKTLAGEVARDGVTVNVLAPGRIGTARTQALDAGAAERAGKTVEEIAAASRATIPAGRYGAPAEFGATAAFLAGQPASYITGSTIRIDGGMIRSV